MNKTIYKIICGAICAMFAISILIFASSIIADKNNDVDNAIQSFKKLSYKTAVAAQQYEPSNPDNSAFAVEFIKAIEDIDQYAELSLRLNEKLIYQYPPVENFSIDASAIINQEENITTLYGNSLKLQASIYKINPSNIYYKARLPFIIILSGTIITILMLIFIPNVKKDDDNDDEYDYDYEKYTDYEDSNEEQITETQKNTNDENISKNEKIEDEYKKPSEEEFFIDEPTIYETSDIDENVVSTEQNAPFETIENPAQYQEETHQENQAITDNAQIETEEFEKNLENILDLELEDATQTNQDVSLLIIKINQLDKTSLITSQIQDLMISKFSENGIVFNFNEDSYALILIDTNLEEAMEDAEDLRAKIISILKTNNMMNEVSIGISSKNTRKINSDRLINEAEKAQEHSDADSPIIAFRVDPEKYKKIYND